jgi:predicted ATP-grasp superfamily ATP-dependent carboligase
MTRVLVTDARRGSAVAFIRSLGRRGDHVVAADATAPSAGMRSRFAGGHVRYPAPALDPVATGDALVQAAHDHRIELIVPITDEVILALRDRLAELPAGCQVAIPDSVAAAAVNDKRATMDLAASLGIPIPESVPAASPEAIRAAAGHLGYPVVIKPLTSRIRGDTGGVRQYAVSYALDAAGVERSVAGLDDVGVLVQRYWSGEGQGVELLLDHGRPVAAFQHRRLREVPVSGGASSLRASMPLDPTLFDHAARLMGALAFHGLAMVEFRVGPEGPALMEVNGRVWGSIPLAVAAGMDFPARLVDLYTQGDRNLDGQAPEHAAAVATGYTIGVRARNLELDLVWIGSVLRGPRRSSITPWPPRRAAFGAISDLVDPSIRDDILAWDDPAPGAAELVRIAGKLGAKFRNASHAV